MNEFESRLIIALDPVRRALADVVAAFDEGRKKYPCNEGFQHPTAVHLECAEGHLAALKAGDRSEPHLAHATARLLLALESSHR